MNRHRLSGAPYYNPSCKQAARAGKLEGRMPASWTVTQHRRRAKAPDFDKNFLTYKGQRWPREMFLFIAEEVAVPREKLQHVADIFTEIMSLNVTSNLRPKVQFLSSELNISGESLGLTIGAFPQILGLSLNQNLRPKIMFFRETFNVSIKDLLSYSLENNIKPKILIFKNYFGISEAELGKMFVRYPSIFANSIDNHLMPLMDFLLIDIGVDASRLKPNTAFFTNNLKIARSDFARMIEKCPWILCMKIETIQNKIELMTEEIGFTKKECVAMLKKEPYLLSRSRYRLWSTYNGLVDAGIPHKSALNVRPAKCLLGFDALLQLLKISPRILLFGSREIARNNMERLKALGFGENDVLRLLKKNPNILTTINLSDNVVEIDKLLSCYGFQDQEIVRVFERAPQIMGSNITRSIKPSLLFLRDELNLSDSQIHRLVKRAPQILSLSPDRVLRPHTHCLLYSIGISPPRLANVLCRAPSLLYLSIEETIIPNFNFFVREGFLTRQEFCEVMQKNPSILCAR
ncbi:hypothetical protein GUITHDRAFT_105830 [Guillardia theta CCMP2712]|uniref:Uncharacterized protein n=1 Tax=Guillardia theta (strain CCMP2712) TaxID=905079 RepID=L1JI67_GUITC|nr:hypothetical protein GUITHDRAFT_105830 [Guillardia theta CCMP2712]EKX48223.1 hypothetical protein GUITHDRAFT_105830 [Guillardia theta CCMP2712]|eukprot:XP_005835203.1 hypothetical protein GUITHDRAFT_105830 [Guillardia theta CCMP2712]